MSKPLWADEIFDCGDLPQENTEETSEEGARRWERYTQLADGVTGSEGTAGVSALIRSFRVDEDFGAYESAIAALQRFPRDVLGRGVAESAATLTEIPEDWSGNVLLLTVQMGQGSIDAFNRGISSLAPRERESLARLIEFHESNEWLSESDCRGKLIS
ncbi:hypothetical protein [Streptomyces sp. NPDC127092]|uniref:hypothetical protein n=1 Tax=Streptomyces sp. NPDC127092 TaxID=3347135 RepID=UPI00365F7FCF